MRGKRLMATAAGAAILLVLAFATPSGAAAGDWAQFRHDNPHSGSQSQETIIDTGNVASLAAAWTGTTGGFVESSPAVANGVAYVGSGDGNLYAFDAAGVTNCSGTPVTCTPLWIGPTGTSIDSSPAVANGVVYVGSEDGNLYAFDAAGVTNCFAGSPPHCDPLWVGFTANPGAIFSSPAVANGVVYVGSSDGNLYAFDAAGVTNCTPAATSLCSFLWIGPTGGIVFSSPAVANGVAYVGSGDGKLYAFDAAGVTNCSGDPGTCTPLWTGATGSFVESSPAVVNGVAYVGSEDHKLYAFDAGGVTNCSGTPTTCTPLWTGATGSNVDSSPAVANGVVYTGSSDGKLYAFDSAGVTNCSGTPTTCTPLWTGDTGSNVISSPAVANGVVYVGSEDHDLHAFDAAGVTNCSGTPTTCTPLWTGATGAIVDSSPAVANGAAYVGSGDDNLYAFALAVSDTSVAASYTIAATAGPDRISVSDGPVVSGFQTVEVKVGLDTWDLANKSTITVQGANGADTITIDNPTAADGVSSIVVNGQGNDDSGHVVATASGISYALDTGAGSGDTVEVGSTLNGIGGELDISDLGDGAAATLDDSADTSANVVTVSSGVAFTTTYVTGASPGEIDLTAVPSITVDLGSGNDVLKVTGSDPSVTYHLDLGDGNDTFGLKGSASIGTGTPVDGGAGTDTLRYVQYGSAATVDLGAGTASGTPGVTSFENVVGSPFADTLIGDDGPNTIQGFAGGDHIFGTGGPDTLVGTPGADTMDGGAGADKLQGQGGDDQLKGDIGNDKLVGGAGGDSLQGGDDDDTLRAKDSVHGNDSADGGNGTDTCVADAGDTVVNCEA